MGDRGEIVVRQHHLRGLLGDLGAVLAHGGPDIGTLQRRRIIHAVAGHGYHLTIGLHRLDQPQFMLGTGACKDVHFFDHGP